MTTAPDDANRLALADLAAILATAEIQGPVWSHQSVDLSVNLVVFPAGEGVAEHVNAEVDVLIVGLDGDGTITIDGQAHALRPGTAVVIPKGARRAIRAGNHQIAYLTCHRRRAGLVPATRTPSR